MWDFFLSDLNLTLSSTQTSVWASAFRTSSASSAIQHDPDSIEAYLSTPQVSEQDIDQAGGVLAYWEQARETRPKLARMALDFLSAPGMFATGYFSQIA